MELKDLLKQAREGKLQCPACGSAGIALCNVEIRIDTAAPILEPGAYGECGKCKKKFPIDKIMGTETATLACEVCSNQIPDEKMRPSPLSNVFGALMPGMNVKTMPNIMAGLAMKCNICGVWICSKCAEKTAMSQGAGSILHTNCGGMFETP